MVGTQGEDALTGDDVLQGSHRNSVFNGKEEIRGQYLNSRSVELLMIWNISSASQFLGYDTMFEKVN